MPQLAEPKSSITTRMIECSRSAAVSISMTSFISECLTVVGPRSVDF